MVASSISTVISSGVMAFGLPVVSDIKISKLYNEYHVRARLKRSIRLIDASATRK